MSERTEQFLSLFAHMERLAAKAAGTVDEHRPVTKNISTAAQTNKLFRNYGDDLRACARLRNVLVHQRYESMYLAEPTPALVERLKHIVQQIDKPLLMAHEFSPPIREFVPEDSIGNVLEFLAEQDFSQTFIRVDGRLEILTANTIQRWLGNAVKEEVIDPSRSVGGVLAFKELENEMVTAPRSITLVDVLDQFDSERNPHLAALVVTENGRPTEIPIGLVTPSDLGRISRILEGH